MMPAGSRTAGRATMSSTSDTGFLLCVAAVAAIVGVTLGTIELAALFAGHPGPTLNGAGLGHGLANWHAHAGDPRAGFPQPLRGALPGPVGVYGALALVVAVVSGLGATGGVAYGRRTRRVQVDASARRRQGLPTPRAIARAYPAGPGSIELARTDDASRAVHLGADRSMGAILGPGAGKSVAVVGWILDAPGPVLATSTKTELWALTGSVRKRNGESNLFDPSNVGGQESLRWSPIDGCGDQDTALRRANALMDGAQLTGTSGNAAFFRSAGAIVIRLALHACALDGAGVDELRLWVRDPDNPELAAILARSDAAPGWREDLKQQAEATGETVNNIGVTVATALECFAQSEVRKACSPPPGEGFSLEGWAASSAASLYVVAPRTVRNLSTLSSAFVAEAFFQARLAAYRAPGQRLDPPIRFVLDELPHLCPIDEIDTYIAEGRGPGLPVMWIAQSREQLVERYGMSKANSIIDASEVVLYGGGLDTAGLYESVSARIGDVPIARTTTQRDTFGNISTATMHEQRPIMSPADLYQLRVVTDRRNRHRWGQAMMMGRQGSTVVRLMPWWTRRDADEIAAASGQAKP